MEDFSVTLEQFKSERGKTLHDFLKRPSTWTRGALAPASNEAEFEDG
jgi:hypothetical protein